MRSHSPPKYAALVPPVVVAPTQPSNASAYTLDTISVDNTYEPSFIVIQDDRAPLLSSSSSTASSYGAAPITPTTSEESRSSRKVLINAGLKMSALFILSTLVLGGTLWLALPTLETADRPFLRVPKTFAQLQDLNYLLKKYRDIYPFRIVVCFVTTYLFLQAFSLPGSMYMSILGGAVWGVPIALPLACSCVASGATLCYLISAALGPALLAQPKWRLRLESWSDRVSSQRDNLLSYLIVLRIAPFPPHWVINVLAPHLGIGLIPFWISTFLGILGVTVIHTSIGGGLDQMTSADDFHLISWRNFLGLSAVVVGVLIPVGLRYVFKKQAIELPGEEGDDSLSVSSDPVLAQGPALVNKGKGLQQDRLILLSDSEEEAYVDELDDEEDEILEAGPPPLTTNKGKGREDTFHESQRRVEGEESNNENVTEVLL